MLIAPLIIIGALYFKLLVTSITSKNTNQTIILLHSLAITKTAKNEPYVILQTNKGIFEILPTPFYTIEEIYSNLKIGNVYFCEIKNMKAFRSNYFRQRYPQILMIKNLTEEVPNFEKEIFEI